MGYRCIKVLGRLQLAHRLAWLYVHGVWPDHEIDHLNGIRSDNRLGNLRDVSRTTNSENQRRATVGNTSTKLLGATLDDSVYRRKPFKAQIKVNGRSRHLGMFATAEEAHQAYVDAKRQLHEGCTI